MMRRAVGLCAVGLFAACSIGVSAQELRPVAPAVPVVPAGPAPHITFDSKDLNLGEVVRGRDAVATFTYHNTGDAPLRILGAKPG